LYGSGINAAKINVDLYDARVSPFCLILVIYCSLTQFQEHFDQGAADDWDWLNRWPEDEELPGFRQFMERYYDMSQGVSLYILEAFELALKLPPNSITSKITQKASEARILHYPRINIDDLRSGNVSRISPHTDLGIITCLFQDRSGGLEMEDREKPGSFTPIPSNSPFEMVVNISETFQRWTNNQLLAGVHQVTIPAHLKSIEAGFLPERYSVTYFVKADRDACVGPLPQFVSEMEPGSYENITAFDFHQRRLASAYRS
jgi:isopenicillin N synthase-like dioxygenase